MIESKEKILFEEFSPDGNRLFWTESEKAIPEKEYIKFRIKNSGCKFKLNGKVYKP